MAVVLDLDIPPALEERVVCSIAAALEYNIPADILLAIAELENGSPVLFLVIIMGHMM